MKRYLVGLIIIIVSFFIIDNIVNYVMMKGVDNYYGLNSQADILLIGHSHLMLATDKQRMEDELGMRVAKYCREGVNVSDRKMMIEHFLNNGYADSLKYVLYGVDLATFTGSGLSQNSYKLFYPFMDNKYVGEYIADHATPIDYWLHRCVKSTRFNDDVIKNSVVRGWFNNWDNFKTNIIDIDTYKIKLAKGEERHIQMNEELVAQFKESISLLTHRGIKVILVNTPTLDLLNRFEPEKYDSMMSWFNDYAANNDLIDFWNFNPKFESDYSIFSDRLHLNAKGQAIITDEIISKINQL